MEKPESFEIPEINDIIQNLAFAGRTLAQLRMYELLDRLEELAGDIEEEGLKMASKKYECEGDSIEGRVYY